MPADENLELEENHNTKLIDIALEIQGRDAVAHNKVNFVSLNFIQTILPHSKVNEEVYNRVNGDYKLRINSSMDSIVPYGTIPRAILAWVVTEAIKTNSREIHIGSNLSEFMQKVGYGADGRTMKRFKEQCLALFSASIMVSYKDDKLQKGQGIFIASNYEFWWENEKSKQLNLFSSKIKLSEEFFNLVKKYKVPVDLRALEAFRNSPLAIDVYSWLTYRYHSLLESTLISWEALQFQFGSGYKENRISRQSFKRAFKKTLDEKISIIYPQAKYEFTKDGLIIHPSPTHIEDGTK